MKMPEIFLSLTCPQALSIEAALTSASFNKCLH